MYDCEMKFPKSNVEPSVTTAGQFWWDTETNLVKVRNGANTAWVVTASFDGTTYIPYAAGLPAYESGTWTPALAGSVVAGTQTYLPNGVTGVYTRWFNLVHCDFNVSLSAYDSATSGTLLITGLPFICAHGAGAAVRVFSGLTFTAGHTYAAMAVNLAADYLVLFQNGSGLNTTALDAATANPANSTRISGSVTYRIQ